MCQPASCLERQQNFSFSLSTVVSLVKLKSASPFIHRPPCPLCSPGNTSRFLSSTEQTISLMSHGHISRTILSPLISDRILSSLSVSSSIHNALLPAVFITPRLPEMRVFPLLVFVSSLVVTVSSIKCYVCNSLMNKDCEDNYQKFQQVRILLFLPKSVVQFCPVKSFGGKKSVKAVGCRISRQTVKGGTPPLPLTFSLFFRRVERGQRMRLHRYKC